jgi:hypothetical protein
VDLYVETSGRIRCIYGEDIDLSDLGRLAITRASYVEPGSDGCWTVDLSPVNGLCLGGFPHRSEALHAERRWLETRWS